MTFPTHIIIILAERLVSEDQTIFAVPVLGESPPRRFGIDRKAAR
jgi:hypothetical protein